MGVPKFYRWLSERYPLINRKIGTDPSSLPAFDCFYLDLNGIIHTSSHNNSSDNANISFDAICNNVFLLVDKLVHAVQPRKVLYLAIDGCAPRAKMNQQRSRRFSTARDRLDALKQLHPDMEGEELLKIFEKQFDSNCITPGTEFMAKLDAKFRAFVDNKVRTDVVWKRCEVIFSGHNVPGEGEHKIMDFIRSEFVSNAAKKDTLHHVCNSLDADLIMLGLATQESRFSLLREEVDFTGGRANDLAKARRIRESSDLASWEILDLNILRKYFSLEFNPSNIETSSCSSESSSVDPNPLFDIGTNMNPNRVVNDLIVLFMVIGNDFLPHISNVDIHSGALDEMLSVYKSELLRNNQYLSNTEETEINGRLLASILRKTPVKKSQGSVLNEEENEVAAFEFVKGMVWCIKYYFEGVPSWNWFYPFHYAPSLSVLIEYLANTEERKVYSFEKGSPFRPFTQLTCCLPPLSANLLPRSYKNLMLNESSPVISFYPDKFIVDMQGKRNSWEGINILPFIDLDLLQDTIDTCCPDTSLTDAEVLRNEFGAVLHHFPSLVVVSETPKSPQDENHLWDAFVDKTKSSLEDISVDVFGRPSKRCTFVLRLKKTLKLSKLLIPDAEVSVTFPHSCLHTRTQLRIHTIYQDSTSAQLTKYQQVMQDKIDQLKSHLLYGNGKPGQGLGGIEVDDDGHYATLVAPRNKRDTKALHYLPFLQPKAVSDKITYPSPEDGEKAIVLSGNAFGDLCQFENGKWKLAKSYQGLYKLTGVNLHRNGRDQFNSSRVLCKRLGISPQTLGILAGSFVVQLDKGTIKALFPDNGYGANRVSRVDLGLNLKTAISDVEGNKVFYCLPEYSERLDKGGWLYSKEAETVLMEYSKKFPELVTILNDTTSFDDFRYKQDTFNLDLHTLLRLRQFLSSVRQRSGSLVEASSSYMSHKARTLARENLSEIIQAAVATTSGEVAEGYILREHIAKLSKELFLESNECKVGDFVVNVNERSGVVGFGEIGTIMGIYNIKQHRDVEVWYDECQSSVTVSEDSFINITRPKQCKRVEGIQFFGETDYLSQPKEKIVQSFWEKKDSNSKEEKGVEIVSNPPIPSILRPVKPPTNLKPVIPPKKTTKQQLRPSAPAFIPSPLLQQIGSPEDLLQALQKAHNQATATKTDVVDKINIPTIVLAKNPERDVVAKTEITQKVVAVEKKTEVYDKSVIAQKAGQPGPKNDAVDNQVIVQKPLAAEAKTKVVDRPQIIQKVEAKRTKPKKLKIPDIFRPVANMTKPERNELITNPGKMFVVSREELVQYLGSTTLAKQPKSQAKPKHQPKQKTKKAGSKIVKGKTNASELEEQFLTK